MSALFWAELLKLQRQPWVMFWGFLSLPALALVFKIALEAVLAVRSGTLPLGQTDTLLSAARSLGIAGNPISQLLYLIGVSSVFFTEYRFSTWRNLVPRAGRMPLLAAKLLVCLYVTVLGLCLTVVGDMGVSTALSIVSDGTASTAPIQSSGMLVLGAAFAIAFLELATLAVMVAAITIVLRSMIAAIVPVFLLAIGSSLLQAYLGTAALRIPLPSIAADAVRAWLFAGADSHVAFAGFGALLAWCLVAAAMGGAAFSRQPLSTE
jgi:hypothetical protein